MYECGNATVALQHCSPIGPLGQECVPSDSGCITDWAASASREIQETNDLAKTHLPLLNVCTSHDLLVREQTALSSEFQDTLTLKYSS